MPAAAPCGAAARGCGGAGGDVTAAGGAGGAVTCPVEERRRLSRSGLITSE